MWSSPVNGTGTLLKIHYSFQRDSPYQCGGRHIFFERCFYKSFRLMKRVRVNKRKACNEACPYMYRCVAISVTIETIETKTNRAIVADKREILYIMLFN